ncbi:hypothetical protein [Bacillus pinisoli]|uniref:hypothetical protein n=1 Tax=Bacillus pinisoli TaxID=2901866 RepID=UPI001FF4F213|nr:hypothetical protein [Bacillus pinisoli]
MASTLVFNVVGFTGNSIIGAGPAYAEGLPPRSSTHKELVSKLTINASSSISSFCGDCWGLYESF